MHGVQIGHGSNGVANLEWRLPLDSGYSRRTGSTPKQVHLVKRNTNRIIATSATCVALFVRTNLRFYVLLEPGTILRASGRPLCIHFSFLFTRFLLVCARFWILA